MTVWSNGVMFLLVLIFQAISFVSAQSPHTVEVGREGSNFGPPTTSAGKGDTVDFIFYGEFHSVTQSSLEEPCSPLPGGFSSNLLGQGTNGSMPLYKWTLTITNASEPIWFYCAATLPVPHCSQGMVGAINPPSQDAYQMFLAAAKQVTTTGTFSPSLITNGIGATATLPVIISGASTPSMTPTPSSSVDSSTSSSSASTTASTSVSPSPSNNNTGAIIGGAVGAALGAVILLIIGIILCYRIRKQRRQSVDSGFFSYNPFPSQHQTQRSLLFSPNSPLTSGMTTTINTPVSSPNNVTAFSVDSQPNVMTQKESLLRATGPTTGLPELHNHPSVPLQPQRYIPHAHSPEKSGVTQGFAAMYNHLNHPSVNQQASLGATGTVTPARDQTTGQHQSADTTSHSGTSDAMDIKTLAKEVAAVLREKQESFGEERNEGGRYSTRSRSESLRSAPPKYHTVNNSVETP